MNYQIIFSTEAEWDMAELEWYIREKLKSPFTAAKYMKGLNDTILKLPIYVDFIGQSEYVQSKFGNNARRIIFKKMAIIYLVDDNLVYIVRVIPASLIY